MAGFKSVQMAMRGMAFAVVSALVALPAAATDLTLSVSGGDDALRTNLRAAALTATLIGDGATSARDLAAAASADYQSLLGVLYDAGYFGPQISIQLDGREASALPPLVAKGTVQTLAIKVETGPAFVLGQVAITPLADPTDLPEGFATGAPAGTAILRQTTKAAIDAWRAAGHAKARVAGQSIVADHAKTKLDAKIALAPGAQLRFGDLSITGLQRLRQDRIRRIAALPTGKVFSPAELSRVAERLRRTGAFRSVSLTEAQTATPDNRLPIELNLVEAKRRRFGFGAEISSVDGLAVSTFWLKRSLFGGAERLRIGAKVGDIGSSRSGRDYRVDLSFNRPATIDPDTDFYITSEVESTHDPLFTLRRFAFETGLDRIVNPYFKYRFGVRYERVEMDDDFGKQRFTIWSLPLSAQLDHRDNKLSTRSGYFIEAGVTPFWPEGGRDTGTRLKLDLRGYHSFGADKSTTLALRGQLGVVTGPNPDDIPADYLFYSGGGGTVRGQPYQSLAIVTDAGRTVGGKSFAGFSAELRAALRPSLGIVGFYDFGQVAANSDFTGATSHSGAGLGLRYETGIGPIRVDLGVPLHGPKTDSRFQLYIGIGQAF